MPPRAPDTMDPSVFAGIMAEALKDYATKHDSAGTPETTGFAHGSGGLLTYPGVNPSVFQTIVGARPGIIDSIPWSPTVFTHETFQVLTGVQGDIGTEKSAVCDVPMTGGLLKGAKLWAPLGRYERASVELEVNRLGQFLNRADPTYLRLVGSPLSGPNQFTPMSLTNDVLINEIAKRKFEMAVSVHRKLAQTVWTGNPVNNTAGGGYKEMVGLSLLVNTGQKDAETGAAIAALDPDVKAFGYVRIDSTAGQSSIINQLTYILRTRLALAEATGVLPVDFVLAMRETLFYELTKVWPCSYLTTTCQVTGNNSMNLDARDITNFRDDMRNNRFLMIDGRRVRVLFDDGIPEYSNTTSASVPSGCFASDIYLLPLTVLGGTPVLYGEYFDYSNPSISSALAMDPGLQAFGPFLQQMSRKGWCIQWWWKTEPRIILRTPWLAGRITNVVYCPLQHTRDAFPSNPYFINGGQTSRTGPSLYSMF